MSEASYTAWDDNLYAWPPPEGWYQASDGRWWPAGYGPAVQAPASDAAADPVEPAGLDAADLYDQRTSAIPAGGLAAAAAASAAGPADRAEAESRRRVFDELPPIDDVFGGIDPYADDEEAMASSSSSSSAEPEPLEAAGRDPGPTPNGSDGPGAPGARPADDGYLLLGPSGPPDSGAGPTVDVPAANGAPGVPPVAPPSPSSLLGGRGGDNGSAAPDTGPSAFDDAATAFAPSAPPSRPDPAPGADDPTGPMAGRPTGSPPEPPPVVVSGPGRPPVEEWATATTILPQDDDSATSQLGLDALREADRAAGAARNPELRRDPEPYRDGGGYQDPGPGRPRADRRDADWGPDADWASGDEGIRRPAHADPEPVLTGGGVGFHRDQAGPGDDPLDRSGGYGDYGDVPIGAAPAPRRWWPLVAIGLAVLVAAASIGGYFALRDDTQSSATGDGDPAADGSPGSFANPYPFGKVVVVYYNDEATKEQRRWVIQVLAPVADATQQLVGAGTASAPGQGEVLAQTRVRITYQSGPEPGSLSDLRFKAVGAASGTVFDAAVACPAAAPLDEAAQVKVLDSAEGDLCWRIPQGELATLKLAVEAEAADGTVHMELNAPAG